MESIDQMSGFVMVLWKAIYELKSEHVICGKHFPTFGLHQSTKSSLYDQSKSSRSLQKLTKVSGSEKVWDHGRNLWRTAPKLSSFTTKIMTIRGRKIETSLIIYIRGRIMIAVLIITLLCPGCEGSQPFAASNFIKSRNSPP